MCNKNSRVTVIMGAGAVLDMDFPDNVLRPTTANITDKVREPYLGLNNNGEINLVDEIYHTLVDKFPCDQNLWWIENPKPNIHFEILFHVLEQLRAYSSVWDNQNRNPETYPYFAPFTQPNIKFSSTDLFQVMKEFVARIMKIVNAYNNYFQNDNGKEDWYRDFFKADFKWDIFNFNYDTTVEQCLKEYEDGFESVEGRADSKFNPTKLYVNAKGLSTINHIHGCIRYYYKDNINSDLFETSMHDLYLYPSFEDVSKRFVGRSQSSPSSQANEEYIAGPIITGLRKTDKVTCVPYAFYHSNLCNAITRNNAMVIVGYSFGDRYVNDLVKRMHSIWGGKERVVLIDKWNENMMKYKADREKFIQTLSAGELEFIQMISECKSIDQMVNFIDGDIESPKYSKNGNLMLLINGMKKASEARDQIYSYLMS